MSDPDKFKKVEFIDGQYGQKTKNNFLDDSFRE